MKHWINKCSFITATCGVPQSNKLLLPLWPRNSHHMWFVISRCRRDAGGATSKVNHIREGRLPPAESPSGRFLRRVDLAVGEPVHSSQHPSSALTHTGAHGSPQQGINTEVETRGLGWEGSQRQCVCFPSQKALQEFVLAYNRSAELHSLPDQVYILDENAFFNDMRLGKKERKRLNITATLKKSLSFSLPGTKLSVDFFKDQVCVCGCVCSAWWVLMLRWCYHVALHWKAMNIFNTVLIIALANTSFMSSQYF